MLICIEHYRFSFNGQERTDEIAGIGNHNTAEFWEYDTRLGRRWNLDPVDKPWQTRYHAFSNKPILNIDPNGANDDEFNVHKESGAITKVSDKGGDKVDYYNVGKTNDKDEFKTEQTLEIKRPEGGGNINSFRFKETEKSTTSTYNIPGTDIQGFILEPAGPSTATANQDKRIPEGTYNLENYSSANYPNNFRIYSNEVPKARLILLHSGNFPSNTEGCLLPGETQGLDYVGSSAKNLGQLRTYIHKKSAENVQLNVYNIIK